MESQRCSREGVVKEINKKSLNRRMLRKRNKSIGRKLEEFIVEMKISRWS